MFGPNVDVDQIAGYLNDAGGEGWELASVVDLNWGNGATVDLLVILKRPRRS